MASPAHALKRLDGWIVRFMQQAVAESHAPRPDAEVMLARMSEMMFVDAVRRYADQLPLHSNGWIAGLRDRFVGNALALLHDQPAQDWSIDELGRRIGLSRSALHERFVELIGLPPMQYLAEWRMQAAARLLLETRATVASIALDVGYDSEAAFTRAFKRIVGAPRPPGVGRARPGGRDRRYAASFLSEATTASPKAAVDEVPPISPVLIP